MSEEVIDPSIKANSTAKRIQRSLRFLIIATILLFIFQLGLVAWFSTKSKDNTDALCAYRTDLEARLQTNQTLLQANPQGIKGLITGPALKVNIDNQKRVIEAFHSIKCAKD